MEDEVFKFKKLVERCVEANFDIINDMNAIQKGDEGGVVKPDRT